jgi:hypothetical protein
MQDKALAQSANFFLADLDTAFGGGVVVRKSERW